MIIYLSILITVNSIYKGNIGYVALKWKSSTICKLIGSIIMLSVEVSTLATALIAIDRFICIVITPFKKVGFETGPAIISIIVSWICGAILPVLSVLLSGTFITNSACIVLGDSISMLFSILYIIFNSIIFICLTVVYLAVLKTVVKSSQVSKSHDKSAQVTLRLGAVILTNFVAWFTISILSILSMFHVSMPASIESVVALVILPVNSFLNPIINTITAPNFVQVCIEKANWVKLLLVNVKHP